VSHPFLSLRIALRVAAFRSATTIGDRRIVRLHHGHLDPFGRFASPAPAESGTGRPGVSVSSPAR